MDLYEDSESLTCVHLSEIFTLMPVLGETMSEGAELARFSHKGELCEDFKYRFRLIFSGDLLAVSSPDGRLTLWSGGEGAGSRLEQQLVSISDHPTHTCCQSFFIFVFN